VTSGQSPAAGPPSPSGVRRGGDRFQDLFVLAGALTLLRRHRGYTQLEVEARGVSSLDDVILRAGNGKHEYGQVKWATNPADLLNEDFLLKRKDTGTSILQKLYKGWGKVSNARDGEGSPAPTLRLITNRAPDPSDPLLGHLDGRFDTLVPFAADVTSSSAAGQALARWCEHLEASRAELLAMLARLQFVIGRSVSAEIEAVRNLMDANGFDDSDRAIDLALSAVQRWVINGRRVLTAGDVAETLTSLGLERREPSAILSVQAIDTDPLADEADEVLNWLPLYDGDSPRARIVPREQSAWAHMASQLDAAAAAIEARGLHSTIVRGAMRQATRFRVGIALPHTRGHELTWRQVHQSWKTTAAKMPAPVTAVTTELEPAADGGGPDLVVAVAVSTDPTADVLRYIEQAGIPAAAVLTVAPDDGVQDQSVNGAGHAIALAEAIRNAARAAVAAHGARTVHLFLAGPGGLALILGHRWNRVAPTVVYEHRGVGLGYVPAFDVDA
jgi:hypothetical protein